MAVRTMESDGSFVEIEDFGERLLNVSLSISEAAKIAGVSRKTMHRICSGERVRKLSAFQVVEKLRSSGYDLDPDGEIVTHKLTHIHTHQAKPDYVALQTKVELATKCVRQAGQILTELNEVSFSGEEELVDEFRVLTIQELKYRSEKFSSEFKTFLERKSDTATKPN